MGKKGERNLRFMVNGEEIMRFSARDLLKYGIYITNNARKMHGETMTRRIAGRKRVRKPRPRKQLKTKGVKK